MKEKEENKKSLPIIGHLAKIGTKSIDSIKNITNIKEKIPHNFEKIRVLALVGKSGSGKSFKAQKVAFKNDIECIIDDGLLIMHNRVLAGVSAKKAKTKLATIKEALFMGENEQNVIKQAIKNNNVKSILILGTSNKMVEEIRGNLGLPEFERKIQIEEISTKDEIENAINIRKTQGKHIIPVPTFEIKRDFSGIILDPFKSFKNTSKKDYERSIIRPTFSYLGKFTIKDRVFRDIIQKILKEEPGINKINKIIINKQDDNMEDINISMDIVIVYGNNIQLVVDEFNEKLKKEIEQMTLVTSVYIKTQVVGMHIEK